MIIGTVTGSVWATRKTPCLQGQTFLVVDTLRGYIVAADHVGAGTGDKVLLGIGPEIRRWEDLQVETTDTLALVTSVQPRYWRGTLCHTEARG